MAVTARSIPAHRTIALAGRECLRLERLERLDDGPRKDSIQSVENGKTQNHPRRLHAKSTLLKPLCECLHDLDLAVIAPVAVSPRASANVDADRAEAC